MRVCSVRRSDTLKCLFLRASSLATNVSRHVGWGRYLPGCTGMKSLIDLPNTAIAGDSPVSLSGVFLYWSMARMNLSVSRVPFGPVFSMIMRFAVFTPTSARQLLCGLDTDDRRW